MFNHSTNVGSDSLMAIYSLDGEKPDLPAEGSYWIAPDAQVIGRVRLAEDVGVWFGCAATMNGSPSAPAPMCRKAR